MKRIVTLIIILMFFSTICPAQNGMYSVRAGGGPILDEPLPGISCAFDVKMGKLPIVLTPYFQYYKNKEVIGKLYTGLRIQLSKNLSKGFYCGFGCGITQWEHKQISVDENTCTSFNLSPVVGMRARITDHLSFFIEGTMYFNLSHAKINIGTSSYPIWSDVFNADIPGIMGLSYVF